MAPKKFFLTASDRGGPPQADDVSTRATPALAVRGPIVTVSEGMIDRIEAQSAARTAQTAELLTAALQVNDDSIGIVRNIESDLHRAEGEMIHVAETLEDDRERIKRVDEKLKSMDSLIARARRELIYIIRNLCKDRCFTFLIILTLVAVSCIGALFIRDSIASSNQSKQTTVVVQPAPPSTVAPAPT